MSRFPKDILFYIILPIRRDMMIIDKIKQLENKLEETQVVKVSTIDKFDSTHYNFNFFVDGYMVVEDVRRYIKEYKSLYDKYIYFKFKPEYINIKYSLIELAIMGIEHEFSPCNYDDDDDWRYKHYDY
jgi:hypothetical protein